MNNLYIDKGLIEMDLDLKNKVEVIERLSDIFESENIVKKSYKDAVLKREEEFPTALKSKNIAFAIPHTDPKHVNKAAIAMARLKEEVDFVSMENYDKTLGVKLVFLLAITDPSKQVKILQKLIKIMQSKKLVEEIINSKNKEELAKILEENLDD